MIEKETVHEYGNAEEVGPRLSDAEVELRHALRVNQAAAIDDYFEQDRLRGIKRKVEILFHRAPKECV